MPGYILIAGVNGAGKSTLYHILDNLHDMPRINIDEIVWEFGDWKNPSDVMKAGKIAVKQLRQLLEDRRSFNQETTLWEKNVNIISNGLDHKFISGPLEMIFFIMYCAHISLYTVIPYITQPTYLHHTKCLPQQLHPKSQDLMQLQKQL